MTSSAGETSFARNEEDNNEEDISNDGGQESEVNIGEENIQDSEVDSVAPHKKRQQVRSNKQALSKVANSLKVMP